MFLGTLLEGEAVLALGGFAAHRGHLRLDLVIAVAVTGSALGDQIWYTVGQRWAPRVLPRFPKLASAVQRVQPRLARHADLFVLINRFLVGLRSAGPLAVGLAGMPWPRFSVLNLLGAIAWSSAVALTGYLVGEGLERLLGDLRRIEEWIFAGVLAAAVLLFLVKRLRARRRV